MARTIWTWGTLSAVVVMMAASPASAQFHDGRGGPGPEWRGAPHNEWRGPHPYHGPEIDRWHGGNWWHGPHGGRDGWWWIVGGVWYWYPAPVYPYPDPYLPPGVVAAAPGMQYYYYCPNPPGYYPAVPACPSPWQMVAATPPAATVVQPVPVTPAPVTSGGIDKTTGGTVLGAVGGAVAGAQFGHGTGRLAATALGTLLGAFVGHEVGESLDRADVLAAQRAEQNAYQAPIGQSIAWNNPESGNSGTIVPVRDGTDSGGNYCREYQQTVVVGGRTESAYGRACRQPDGSWKVVQ